MEPRGHWVEKLFPPTYSYTLEGILRQPLPPRCPSTDPQPVFDAEDIDEEGSAVVKKDDIDNKMTLFEQLAKQIRPGDVSSIKNVYERVWLMVQMEHEEKLKKEQG